jgi:hypothetical protein
LLEVQGTLIRDLSSLAFLYPKAVAKKTPRQKSQVFLFKARLRIYVPPFTIFGIKHLNAAANSERNFDGFFSLWLLTEGGGGGREEGSA